MDDRLEELDRLGGWVRVEFEQAERHWQTAVEHAIRCGRVLIAAKELCRHGEWAAWLEANFPASERSAQRYMQVARNPPRVADSLNAAVEQIARKSGTAQQRAPSPEGRGVRRPEYEHPVGLFAHYFEPWVTECPSCGHELYPPGWKQSVS